MRLLNAAFKLCPNYVIVCFLAPVMFMFYITLPYIAPYIVPSFRIPDFSHFSATFTTSARCALAFLFPALAAFSSTSS